MKKCLILFIFVVHIVFSSVCDAHPSLAGNAHPHNNNLVVWEADLVKDGSVFHNHYDLFPFNGAELYIQPAGFGVCWDDSNVRKDEIGLFTKGHCYINPFTINGTPTYYFEGNWNSEAKARVRDAFTTFSNIELTDGTYQMGMYIDEIGIAAIADIIVTWEPLDPMAHGGYAELHENFGPKRLHFDSTFDWYYGFGVSNVPDDKWHFYSVALHEVGHVFGLGHQPAGDVDDIMNGPVGTPADGSDVSVPHDPHDDGRHFGFVDEDSVFGLTRMYTQPKPIPDDQCDLWFEFNSCNGSTASHSLSATAGEYSIIDVSYDVSYNSSNWINIFNGAVNNTCPSFSATVGMWGRASFTLSYGQATYTSVCTIYVPQEECGGPGGGPNPF